MINHPQMPAPKPVGPKNPDEFWAKDDGKKLESTLEHFDKSIDWGESDPDCLLWLAKDIDKGLDMVRD